MHKALLAGGLVVGALAIAVLSFASGLAWGAAGYPVVSIIEQVAHHAGYVPRTGFIAQIVAHDDSSITVAFPDGKRQVFSISPQTVFMKEQVPVLQKVTDASVGDVALIATAGTVATLVQIIPPPSHATSTP